MTSVTSSKSAKPFVPKQIFLAHEFFLKGVYFDHRQQFDQARDFYLRSSKIFTYLINNHPDMTLFELWGDQARLAIARIKQLDSPDFKLSNSNNNQNSSPSTQDDKEKQLLTQRAERARLVPNRSLSWKDIIGLDEVVNFFLKKN